MVSITQNGAPYRLFITRPALKDLKDIPQRDADAILTALDTMCRTGTGSVSPLTRSKRGGFRLRVGKFRAIFDVAELTEQVQVTKGGRKVLETRTVNEVQVIAIERRNDKTYSNTKKR